MYVIIPWRLDVDHADDWVHEGLFASEDEARAEAADLNKWPDYEGGHTWLVGEVTILPDPPETAEPPC